MLSTSFQGTRSFPDESNAIVRPAEPTRSIAVMPGGGSWGIISAFTAREYEKQSGQAFHENFDQVEAVSVGTLNAAVLWPLECSDSPLLDARDLKYFYMTQTDDLFSKNLWSLNGLVGHKYNMDNLEDLMEDTFGDLKLSDYADGLHIYVVDMATQSLRKLTSEDAKLDPANDFYIKDLIRTAISAPYYFEPVRIQNMAGETQEFIDAGVWASNPAFKAYFDTRAEGVEPENMAITVFDTGTRRTDVELEDIDSGIRDVDGLVQLIFNTSANTYEEMLDDCLGDNYTNISTDVSLTDVGLVTNNTEKLIPYAQRAVRDNMDLIGRAVDNASLYKDTGIAHPVIAFNDSGGFVMPSAAEIDAYGKPCQMDHVSDFVHEVRELAAQQRASMTMPA